MTTAALDRPVSSPGLLTVDQVADRYGVGVSTVWKWQGTGHIPPAKRMGERMRRWLLADLIKWEQAGFPQAQTEPAKA